MNEDFTRQRYPQERHATRDVLNAAARKHMMHAMVEVDVTDARRLLRELGRETGRKPSITALVIAACSQAVERNPVMHGYRDLRNRLVLFKDVDVSMTVERIVDGESRVIPTIIRAANRKSVMEISDEIDRARSEDAQTTGVASTIRAYLLIPPFLRRLVFRLLDRMPQLMRRKAGTIMVTSVGMFGSGASWGIPLASHTLNVTVGGIVARPVVKDGKVEERDHLCMTVSFDHDIVDGAPAARFLHRLRRLIEKPSALITI
jgi:pyruvate/2-oxoglutarate dehydrogenase complex dihydrolipoamide acyltransferase (E2) component